jgi:hypothetical protein
MIDIELGDDLLNQVEVTNGPLPEDTKTKNLKFDAKGTLHMMCRDDDGKLLKDISVRNVERAPSYSDEVMREYKTEHEELTKKNHRFNLVFNIIVIAIAVTVLFMVFTLIMR